MTVDEIVSWFSIRREVRQSSSDAVALLASSHPRTVFIKTLPPDLNLLHIGAEFGAIDIYLRWPPPAREDLRVSALVNSAAANLTGYKEVECGDLSHPKASYSDRKFGAVVCSMVLHRIEDPAPLLQWITDHTLPQARILLEWPSPFSTLLPTRAELKAANIDLVISNFADDLSHLKIHERSRIVSLLSKMGFFIESQGYLSLPFIEHQILAHHALGFKDDYALQTAFWSKTKWMQYLIAVRN